MKKGWLAGLLAFIFSGLGHLYLRKFAYAALFFVGYIVLILLPGFVGNTVLTVIGGFGAIALWVINIIHAVNTAKSINESKASTA